MRRQQVLRPAQCRGADDAACVSATAGGSDDGRRAFDGYPAAALRAAIEAAVHDVDRHCCRSRCTGHSERSTTIGRERVIRVAAHRVRRLRAPARLCRPPRRDVLFSRATDQRDRHSSRARRAAIAGAVAGVATGRGALRRARPHDRIPIAGGYAGPVTSAFLFGAPTRVIPLTILAAAALMMCSFVAALAPRATRGRMEAPAALQIGVGLDIFELRVVLDSPDCERAEGDV